MTGFGQFLLRHDETTGVLESSSHVLPRGTKVVAFADDTLAAKVPGTHVYSGQGRPQRYAGGGYEVFRVLEERDNGWMLCTRLMRWPLR